VNPRAALLNIVRRIGGNNGAWLTRKTEARTIRRLIAGLTPVATDKPLVRIGPYADGGYLVPDDLQGIVACFSPGVSLVSGFEKQCAEAGMAVFLADASVDGPAEPHPSFVFQKKFVGVTSDATFMTIDSWVRESLPGTSADLLLQIDIEGYEYEVFIGMSDSLLRRFRIIVAEFHDLHELWNDQRFRLASRAFDKLLQTHACVHIHPNNRNGSVTLDGIEIPRVAEFTFLRRDRIIQSSPAAQFPHPLDRDNTTNSSLPLPACWMKTVA
jgi:hypothetical protein